MTDTVGTIFMAEIKCAIRVRGDNGMLASLRDRVCVHESAESGTLGVSMVGIKHSLFQD